MWPPFVGAHKTTSALGTLPFIPRPELAIVRSPNTQSCMFYARALFKTILLRLPAEHPHLYAQLWFTTSNDNE